MYKRQIENSSTGSISAVYDLLGQYGCAIVGEQIIRVEHALMAPKGASLDSICQVYSHEQGLLQCRPFLAQYPQWEQQAEPNTALAAKLVAESKDVTKAAIASPQTAALYGLEVLAEDVYKRQAWIPAMFTTRAMILLETWTGFWKSLTGSLAWNG